MAIKGYFESHHPLSPALVKATVSLGRLDLSAEVKFIIDTGALHTILGPADLNLDYSSMQKESMVEIGGLTGSALFYREQASVILLDQNDDIYSFDIDICIPGDVGSGKLASILGRDVLNRCEVKLNFNFGLVELVGPSRARISPTSGWFF